MGIADQISESVCDCACLIPRAPRLSDQDFRVCLGRLLLSAKV